jgi:hypothetical protein
MINEVRNTVMHFLNKDNNGYITPAAFNTFARQAQIEIFEQCFFDYNNAMVRMNNRMSGSGYGDIPKHIKETIDIFNVPNETLFYHINHFELPRSVANVDHPGQPVTNDWFHLTNINYNYEADIEKVSENKIISLNNSMIMAPSTSFPVYTQSGDTITVYPTTITQDVICSYVRYPVDPKWTWTLLEAGEPVFDQGASDYQDFELPKRYMPDITTKILEYAGISIREPEIVQVAKTEEVQRKQLEQ